MKKNSCEESRTGPETNRFNGRQLREAEDALGIESFPLACENVRNGSGKQLHECEGALGRERIPLDWESGRDRKGPLFSVVRGKTTVSVFV